MSNAIKNIENNPVYQQVLSDSFGGVMYDVANQGKYNSKELLQQWEQLTESQKNLAGGIMKGAIDFLQEKQV